MKSLHMALHGEFSSIEIRPVSELVKLADSGDQSNLPVWIQPGREVFADGCQYLEGVDWRRVSDCAIAFLSDSSAHPDVWDSPSLLRAIESRFKQDVNTSELTALVSIFTDMIEVNSAGGIGNGRHRIYALKHSGVESIPVHLV